MIRRGSEGTAGQVRRSKQLVTFQSAPAPGVFLKHKVARRLSRHRFRPLSCVIHRASGSLNFPLRFYAFLTTSFHRLLFLPRYFAPPPLPLFETAYVRKLRRLFFNIYFFTYDALSPFCSSLFDDRE